MSFQDVGKTPVKRSGSAGSRGLSSVRESSSAAYSSNAHGPLSSSSHNPPAGGGYAQVSDAVLQYQRNVGILERITQQVGTKTDGPTLNEQYKTQVDVIRQLGFKIEAGLRQEEQVMQSLPRNDAARSRATHVKLTRDFRRVEQGFKNLQLEARRKKSAATVAREQQHQHTEETNDESNQLRQMQLQQDSINAEIMREREEEIRNINKGMHTVNEIYKDLAHIVGNQQEQIDQVENQMEGANLNAKKGLEQVEKANAKSSAECTIS
mmetsp:Transcript_7973/g.14376  ORF Transcript_7973/g.14376 Transcript_7973/m.14376 type:complete len:266 (-) Transcript_7973:266-1063(-)|eukprot:CAMPEP_0198290032 /NCGR_PEP_ID=MMETSP1449-20131203/8024_1 /TAXON_ID=420275 /ORGANISM="Attheya septentrionalis, Strain CCMP2084" /LENGTH=265 /DNA_ID=CAMNT_0043988455 /DNA_START=213 /DNA_END=1010 /DNA_ORIENTATION=+